MHPMGKVADDDDLLDSVSRNRPYFPPIYNNPVAFKNALYILSNWGYDCPSVAVTDELGVQHVLLYKRFLLIASP